MTLCWIETQSNRALSILLAISRLLSNARFFDEHHFYKLVRSAILAFMLIRLLNRSPTLLRQEVEWYSDN